MEDVQTQFSSEQFGDIISSGEQFSGEFSGEFSISVMSGITIIDEVTNMHFHTGDGHQQQTQNDWQPTSTVVGAPPSVESIESKHIGSPSDVDNNNLVKPNASPLNQHHQQQHTVSAAADSSDTQSQQQPRVSPQPDNQLRQSQPNHFIPNYEAMPYGNQPQLQQPLPSMSSMHPNADMQYTFMHSYDPYYHPMDFGPPAPFSQLHHQPMLDYKPVPSHRFQPYPTQIAPTASISPRVVSSSGSPSSLNLNPMISGQHQHVTPPGQPTPSPSPKQCDKCTFVCETSIQLHDHYSTAHGIASPNQHMQNNRNGSVDENNMPNFQYQQQTQQFSSSSSIVKDEPNADILDLDSHKMVYPSGGVDATAANNHQQHHIPLPSMQSLQPQRTMIWSPEHHSFLSEADLKQAGYNQNQQPPMMVKREYNISPPIKQEQSAYGHQSHQMAIHPDGGLGASKPFGSDASSSGNHLSTSPSDFPSTTTPAQGLGPAFALDSNDKASPNWKSNEARRPKTYNCTACNKWFTSSGHLKRHYNTTLHKNAVKSSGQVDPATMPINMHHHPHRDQNKLHNRRSPAQAPPHVAPDPPPSPDYGTASTGGSQQQQQQFSPSLGFPQGYQQQHQQFENVPQNHPNGQAGPSVPASQTRGLLIIATNMGTQEQPQQVQQLQLHQQQPHQDNDLYHQEQQELSQHNNMDMLVLDHHQQQPQQHLTSMDQLVDQNQHLLILSPLDQSQSMDHQQQDIFMEMPTHNNMQPMATNNSPQHNLHTQPPPSNTTNLGQFHHHQPPTTTTPIKVHPHQLHSPTESIHTISPCSNPTPTTTTSNIITITNLHSYQEPVDIIQLQQEPSLEHHQHQHQILDTITGNEQLQNANDMVELADLSSTGNILFSNVYADLENQENMDPVYSIVNFNGIVPGGAAPQYANHSAPHSPDTADQPLNNSSQQPNIQIIRVSPNVSQAIVPSTPSPQLHTDGAPTADKPANAKAGIISPYGTTTLSNVNKNNIPAKSNPTKPRAKPSARPKTTSSVSAPNNGPHRCEECDKVFNKACYLTQHNKTFHSGERPFKCYRCGKRFPCLDSHDLHVDKHAGEKPFKCRQCPKQFNHKTDLRRHLCLHSGRKPYACEECGKHFIRKDHMMKHVITHRRKEEQALLKMTAMQEKMRISALEGAKTGGRRPAARAPRKPLTNIKHQQFVLDKVIMVMDEIELEH